MFKTGDIVRLFDSDCYLLIAEDQEKYNNWIHVYYLGNLSYRYLYHVGDLTLIAAVER